MYFQKTHWSNNAKRAEHNGISYHSKFEAGYAAELDLLLKAGKIKSWERQKKLNLSVNGFHIQNYYIDFIVHHFDGTTEYVECKGYWDDAFLKKWRLFEALYSGLPGVKLTIIQQGKMKPTKCRTYKV